MRIDATGEFVLKRAPTSAADRPRDSVSTKGVGVPFVCEVQPSPNGCGEGRDNLSGGSPVEHLDATRPRGLAFRLGNCLVERDSTRVRVQDPSLVETFNGTRIR
jgi:hypothetical protein